MRNFLSDVELASPLLNYFRSVIALKF